MPAVGGKADVTWTGPFDGFTNLNRIPDQLCVGAPGQTRTSTQFPKADFETGAQALYVKDLGQLGAN
jgi:hypothetical protein